MGDLWVGVEREQNLVYEGEQRGKILSTGLRPGSSDQKMYFASVYRVPYSSADCFASLLCLKVIAGIIHDLARSKIGYPYSTVCPNVRWDCNLCPRTFLLIPMYNYRDQVYPGSQNVINGMML